MEITVKGLSVLHETPLLQSVDIRVTGCDEEIERVEKVLQEEDALSRIGCLAVEKMSKLAALYKLEKAFLCVGLIVHLELVHGEKYVTVRSRRLEEPYGTDDIPYYINVAGLKPVAMLFKVIAELDGLMK